MADLKPGETVLDLGSGSGIDMLLSAKRVGPAGKAYDLDMSKGIIADAIAPLVDGKFISAFVSAIKPKSSSQ